jgi:hypothetical protein
MWISLGIWRRALRLSSEQGRKRLVFTNAELPASACGLRSRGFGFGAGGGACASATMGTCR